MEFGYCTVRRIQELCETDIRFLWLLDEDEAPSHMTIENFIKDELSGSIEDIFTDITRCIAEELSVDMNHVYIDGTKLEANAQKYTWVWKKSCIRSRNNVFCKLNELFGTMNETVFAKFGMTAELRKEYSIEYVEYILREYLHLTGMSVESFVHGSAAGSLKRKQKRTPEERFFSTGAVSVRKNSKMLSTSSK